MISTDFSVIIFPSTLTKDVDLEKERKREKKKVVTRRDRKRTQLDTEEQLECVFRSHGGRKNRGYWWRGKRMAPRKK